ncbi:MAG: SEC-C domain-containing protein [Bacteroidales bacterium]|jgi:predicted aspartyl protease|nr:SEC-C domain-containing protein [Bacteroidales bacterium]
MNIPKLSFTLKHTGRANALYTPCHISQAFNPNNKESHKPFKEYRALWDTGATNSVITKKVVEELNLPLISKTLTSTASHSELLVNVYMINIGLPNNVMIGPIRVTEGLLSGMDMLIGMDIISLGDFAITQKDNKTTFSFQIPSTHDIDFVQENKEEKDVNAHTPIVKEKEPNRNDPCPCGSGKKYKHCHGKK